MKYNNAVYYYRKDAQGNIIALLDNSGNTVVKYRYDAWGNHAVQDADGADITDVNHIGVLNPFRYRGYFYDVETGLYYLQTRYYDPESGRFITIDSTKFLDSFIINGLNLYAYSANNPVMNMDPFGTDWNSFWTGLKNGWNKFWKGVGDTLKKVGNDIKNFFVNTFGVTVSVSNSYKAMTVDTIFGGGETGVNSGGMIYQSGDNTPINLNITLPSEWWKIWEFKVGIQVNINDGGFNFGVSPLEIGFAVSFNHVTYDIFFGLNKIGLTMSETESFANWLFGAYQSYYIRTIPTGLIAALIVLTGGAVLPVLA